MHFDTCLCMFACTRTPIKCFFVFFRQHVRTPVHSVQQQPYATKTDGRFPSHITRFIAKNNYNVWLGAAVWGSDVAASRRCPLQSALVIKAYLFAALARVNFQFHTLNLVYGGDSLSTTCRHIDTILRL